MSDSDVPHMIAALATGELSLDEVADQFRLRMWASSRRPEPRDIFERLAQIDPALPVPDSVDDLTAAFDRGELTWEQYRTLAHAVADSINAGRGRAASRV